jgi:hypothetical protein
MFKEFRKNNMKLMKVLVEKLIKKSNKKNRREVKIVLLK